MEEPSTITNFQNSIGIFLFIKTGTILDSRAGTFIITDFKVMLPVKKMEKMIYLNYYLQHLDFQTFYESLTHSTPANF